MQLIIIIQCFYEFLQLGFEELYQMTSWAHVTNVNGYLSNKCIAVYIGETGRTINQRKAEHKKAVMKADPSNTVALHTASTLHAIKWEESKVIDQESNWEGGESKKPSTSKKLLIPLTLTLDFYLTQPGTPFYKGDDIITPGLNTLSTFETVKTILIIIIQLNNVFLGPFTFHGSPCSVLSSPYFHIKRINVTCKYHKLKKPLGPKCSFQE